jgi:PIN domain nuclease of toxin-antitoxin system
VILLDTHAWLWWAGDPTQLSRKARARIQAERDIAISAISCWELAMLCERGRLRLNPDTRLGIRAALGIERLRVVPVNESIATEAALLGAAFHGDPADPIIVATASELRALLITKDTQIRRSRRVPTLW